MAPASRRTTSFWMAWTITSQTTMMSAIVPAPDAVQEFNLITGNAPADFGNYLGGVVNVFIEVRHK